MRFVFVHPEPHGLGGAPLRPDQACSLAAAVEQAGFGAYAFTEHPAPPAPWLSGGGHQTLDPFVALGFIAAETSRIRLLTYLAVAPYRNPALLAKAAASVDVLSGGRMTLGLGAGYLEPEFSALGVDFEERSGLLDEAIEVLALHWSGEPYSYRGIHFQADDVIALPQPVQRPIPIWIGGNSSRSKRRVAERGQGWMPLVGPPELSAFIGTPVLTSLTDLARSVAELRESVEQLGRDPDALDVLYPYADPDLASPQGDVDRHREAFSDLAAIGVTWVALSAPPDFPRALDVIEHLGSAYIT